MAGFSLSKTVVAPQPAECFRFAAFHQIFPAPNEMTEAIGKALGPCRLCRCAGRGEEQQLLRMVCACWWVSGSSGLLVAVACCVFVAGLFGCCCSEWFCNFSGLFGLIVILGISLLDELSFITIFTTVRLAGTDASSSTTWGNLCLRTAVLLNTFRD